MGGIFLGNSLLTHSSIENIIQDNDFYIKANGDSVNWIDKEFCTLNISEPANFTLNDILVAKEEYRDIILQINNLDTNNTKITNYLVLDVFDPNTLTNHFSNGFFEAKIDNSNTIQIWKNNEVAINLINGEGEYAVKMLEATEASGTSSFAAGIATTASGNYSFAEGKYTIASGEGSHAEGAYAEGFGASQATGFGAHAEGVATIASGSSSHAEGGCHLEYVDENGNVIHTTAAGFGSHAEGISTQALGGWGAHAEGSGTIASGDSSHAEGGSNATGTWSHAEGNGSVSSGYAAHAEGYGTRALGDASHAEGYQCEAQDSAAHAEGDCTIAKGYAAHTEGNATIASSDYQHVQGQYNIEDADDVYAHIVGNGSSDSKRSNAHTLDWDGHAWFAGDIYVGSTSGTNKDEGSLKLATVADIEAAIGTAIGGSY